MKNIVSWVCLLALLVCGCGKDEMSRDETVSSMGRVFTTSFEQDGSRTYLADDRSSRWTAKDQISLFDGSTLNLKYEFQGETGATSGDFYMISKPEGTGSTLATNYAVYPYSDNITITDNGTITTTLPAIQPYAQNSFGLGANTMVAVTQDADDTFLTFKNVCGCLMLQFYGENVTVKSVTLTGNQEEKIAGKATLTAAFEEAPSVSMADDATTSITLDCGTEGVQLSASAQEATAFWMAVPPTTFANGFTITVTDMNNKVFTLTTDMETAITRNKVKPIAAVEVNLEDSQALACNLPAGEAFRDAIIEHSEGLGFSSLEEGITGIKFIAQSTPLDKSFSIDCVGEAAYLEKVDDSLYIHTAAQEFVFNEDCSYMFGASHLENRSFTQVTKIDFNQCVNTSQVTDMKYMFFGCDALTGLDLSSFNTSKVTDMQSMFAGCSNLTSLNLNSFDTGSVTNMLGLFAVCSNLTSLDLSKFNTSNVTNMQSIFASCSNLSSLNLSGFDTSNVTNMRAMFWKCSSLTSLDLSHINTINVANISGMFYDCSNITSLDLSNFNTNNVIDMGNMFDGCISLTELNLSSFNTSNVTNMGAMFYNCNSLTSLDLSSFNTSNVTNMVYMFDGCSSLTELHLSNFNTSNVTDMGNLFSNCSNLTTLNLSNFNTGNVTNMTSMFKDCSALTELDLSSFNIRENADIHAMFGNVGANIQENDKTQIVVPSPNPFEGKDETTQRDPNKTEFIEQSSN